MATVALVSNTILCHYPFLVRRLSCTGGSTAAALTHGEDRSPDIAFAQITDAGNPTLTGLGVERNTSATTLTVDSVVDAAETFDVICIWLTSASGGLNPPA